MYYSNERHFHKISNQGPLRLFVDFLIRPKTIYNPESGIARCKVCNTIMSVPKEYGSAVVQLVFLIMSEIVWLISLCTGLLSAKDSDYPALTAVMVCFIVLLIVWPVLYRVISSFIFANCSWVNEQILQCNEEIYLKGLIERWKTIRHRHLTTIMLGGLVIITWLSEINLTYFVVIPVLISVILAIFYKNRSIIPYAVALAIYSLAGFVAVYFCKEQVIGSILEFISVLVFHAGAYLVFEQQE